MSRGTEVPEEPRYPRYPRYRTNELLVSPRMNVWRERLGRWLDPLARRCPLSPNAITILALLLALAASVGIAQPRSLSWLLGSLGILVVAALLDAFDGVVARVKGLTSPFGDFLDHFCDRVADVALVVGWMAGASVDHRLVILTALAVLLNGYAGTQLEATFHVRTYEGAGRGEFIIGIVALPIISWLTRNIGAVWQSFSISDVLAALLLLLALLATLGRILSAKRMSTQLDSRP